MSKCVTCYYVTRYESYQQYLCCNFFFFFQAEDGIRDIGVTGVQTCALPICLIPPGLDGSEQSLEAVLARMVGPGLGLELVSKVNDIPKGSRLAVLTNLLAALIAVCMRATGQTGALTGGLAEGERRTVAARAILGEWLGGSGGGWQDSGGVWPGIKLISGAPAVEGDAEH